MTEKEAIKWLNKHRPCISMHCNKENADNINIATDMAIKALKERLKGEWIVDEDAFSKDFRKCSNCNEDAEWLEGGCQFLPNYCPNCGADMRGGTQ